MTKCASSPAGAEALAIGGACAHGHQRRQHAGRPQSVPSQVAEGTLDRASGILSPCAMRLQQKSGSVLGDGANVKLTPDIERVAWKAPKVRGRFDPHRSVQPKADTARIAVRKFAFRPSVTCRCRCEWSFPALYLGKLEAWPDTSLISRLAGSRFPRGARRNLRAAPDRGTRAGHLEGAKCSQVPLIQSRAMQRGQ